MRVGVAPGTTAFVVQPPDLRDFRCLNCPPSETLMGPMVNGKVDLQAMGIPCPPDPVVQFLTPFPAVSFPSVTPRPPAITPAGMQVTPIDTYGTDSTLMGPSPLGVSWPVLVGIFGAALAGGGVIGWMTRKKRR